MIQLMNAEGLQKLHKTFSGSPYNKPLTLFEEYHLEQMHGMREVYLAYDKHHLVGYVTVLWHSTYPHFAYKLIPEIRDLNVLVEHRRRGHASKLIEHVEKRAQALRQPQIGLGVGETPDYEAARNLYPKLGYTSDGQGPYESRYGNVNYMIKNLA